MIKTFKFETVVEARLTFKSFRYINVAARALLGVDTIETGKRQKVADKNRRETTLTPRERSLFSTSRDFFPLQ